jgi:CspA family cold shock protein
VRKLFKGLIKRWIHKKGYGFIETDDVNEDVFVHHSDVISSKGLEEGKEVKFDVQWTYKGLKAVYVKLI